MQIALQDLKPNAVYDCGSAGTVLRFLALRLSRLPGSHVLLGSNRLLARPQDELENIFSQLNVKLEKHADRLVIHSDGWRPKTSTLKVDRTISSQFASAVLLNAWNLDFPLTLQWDQVGVSEGYWQMSAAIVQEFGMSLDETIQQVTIAKNSRVKIDSYVIESDLSSAFAVAAFAALNGSATFQHFPHRSLQPDRIFSSILEKMNVDVRAGSSFLHVSKKANAPLLGIHQDLNNCPDLFPVLATLCAFANGPSRLDNAPHLVFKESNRIQKIAELLKNINVETKILSDGIEIFPPTDLKTQAHTAPFNFDTDHDHRLAFAAALVKSQGFPIQIKHPEVVAKSFPEFWDIVGYKLNALS